MVNLLLGPCAEVGEPAHVTRCLWRGRVVLGYQHPVPERHLGLGFLGAGLHVHVLAAPPVDVMLQLRDGGPVVLFDTALEVQSPVRPVLQTLV